MGFLEEVGSEGAKLVVEDEGSSTLTGGDKEGIVIEDFRSDAFGKTDDLSEPLASGDELNAVD